MDTSTADVQPVTAQPDEDAPDFEQLYRANFVRLVRFAYYRVGDRATAEDVAAEVFALAWARRVDADTFAVGWLFTAAQNLIGNEYRRRLRVAKHQRELILAELAEPEAWELHVRDLDLRAALARLAPDDALVLQLTYWDGLTASEAGEFLECSTAAVWTRLTRARAALRTQLERKAKGEVVDHG